MQWTKTTMTENEMRQCAIIVRDSLTSDMPSVQRIYAEQVLNGTASFEEVPPSVAEMEQRRQAVLDMELPYLVAVSDAAVIGYAYAGLYRTRAAYRHTVEDTIYVHESHRGLGVGKQLLRQLITRCQLSERREMIGIAGDSANTGSVRLHQACGFRVVGTLERVGFKHGRWLDTVVMQRSLTGSIDD